MSGQRVPYVAWKTTVEWDTPGYFVGAALDELIAYAIGAGATPTDIRERVDEALDEVAAS